MNDYKKNPNRGRRIVKPSYVPEHVKKNVSPIIQQPSKYNEEFVKYNKSKEQSRIINDNKLKEQSRIINDNKSKEQSRIVNSGQNIETSWNQNSTIMEEVIDNEPIYDDEVPYPPESFDKDEIIETEDSGFSFDDVDVGDYVLLYQDNVIGVGDVDVIKTTLNKILFDRGKKISAESFVVVKKVEVKMGLFVDDRT